MILLVWHRPTCVSTRNSTTVFGFVRGVWQVPRFADGTYGRRKESPASPRWMRVVQGSENLQGPAWKLSGANLPWGKNTMRPQGRASYCHVIHFRFGSDESDQQSTAVLKRVEEQTGHIHLVLYHKSVLLVAAWLANPKDPHHAFRVFKVQLQSGFQPQSPWGLDFPLWYFAQYSLTARRTLYAVLQGWLLLNNFCIQSTCGASCISWKFVHEVRRNKSIEQITRIPTKSTCLTFFYLPFCVHYLWTSA